MQFLYKNFIILFAIFGTSACFANQATCSNWTRWLKPVCVRMQQIITTGNDELYFSGYSWHNRFTYNPERIPNYNENAWGGGYGKGFYDEDGDWHGLYGIAFLDSHKNIEPVIGYAFLKVAHMNPKTSIGLGYTFLITMRPDINHGYPIPGLLPWISLTHKKLSFGATYIPGSRNAGNVLYVLSKWTL